MFPFIPAQAGTQVCFLLETQSSRTKCLGPRLPGDERGRMRRDPLPPPKIGR